MEQSILKVDRLSHRYTKNWAIKDISFSIDQKGIVGLLGSNGAGKSTTMNIISGVIHPTEGNVFIDGIDLIKYPELAKKQIGFLPQTAPLYFDLTVDEYLIYCSHFRNIEKYKVKDAVEEAKQKCGLMEFGKRLIKNLSGGYRQRVGIAQAIIHRPKLVILDEPTNGLDPNQILEVRKLIREIALDRAIIFSSHILSEVQILCKEIKMIEGGKMVFADSMNAFNNLIQPHSLLMYLGNAPSIEEILKIPGVTEAEAIGNHQIRLYFDCGPEIAEKLIAVSIEQNWHLREIQLEKGSLDEAFAQLSKKDKR
jgi:ABC-2 type transport system ATP-binding protein